MKHADPYPDLPAIAAHLRAVLDPGHGNKKCILLYAYNGTGKTRLSMEFKNAGKVGDDRDTLYFNAFTEDLFWWDNDLEGDTDRKLRLNAASRFFAGLDALEMDNRIRPLLRRYADFDFRIDTVQWVVTFSRDVRAKNEAGEEATVTLDNIKVSRGEENIFIWCFFLAVAELAILATEEAEPYAWVRYLYIDDPVSSLDEHNAVNVACHIAKLLKGQDRVKAVISTHHTLFFNVLCNELKNADKRFLSRAGPGDGYLVRETGDTPFFHHVAVLAQLQNAADTGELYTYHFNMLRSVLEKTSSFHGFKGFAALIKAADDDPDGVLHGRLLNVMTHGNYSLYEPVEMVPENKEYFRRILADLRQRYTFNPELFEDPQQAGAS